MATTEGIEKRTVSELIALPLSYPQAREICFLDKMFSIKMFNFLFVVVSDSKHYMTCFAVSVSL